MKTTPLIGILALILTSNLASAATLYVDAGSTNPVPPYTNWPTAAAVIQDAVDAAAPDDEVVVTNGVYATGGRAVAGLMTNRVAVDRPIILRSVNGPEFTIIWGYKPPLNNGIADGAVRCVYLTNGAMLSGFTLTNGGTRNAGDAIQEQTGGGVWGATASAVVSNSILVRNAAISGGGAYGAALTNCLLTRNYAYSMGGGSYSATLYNCTLYRNESSSRGGGAFAGNLYNCLVATNQASAGGGLDNSGANNCIVIGNYAGSGGCGAYVAALTNCTVVGNRGNYEPYAAASSCVALVNCIIYHNNNDLGAKPNYDRMIMGIPFSCCIFPAPQSGADVITNEPRFMDLAGGNVRLQANSPCINAGDNRRACISPDMDGNPRLVGGTVDIGAYEFQTPTSVISYAWLQRYALPTDGTADFTDLDGDGFNNWQEWRAGSTPTNALSFLRLLPPAPAGTNLTLTWPSAIGRSYSLDYSPDLSATPRFLPLATNLPGGTGTTTFTLTNPAAAPFRFYRVGVE